MSSKSQWEDMPAAFVLSLLLIIVFFCCVAFGISIERKRLGNTSKPISISVTKKYVSVPPSIKVLLTEDVLSWSWLHQCNSCFAVKHSAHGRHLPCKICGIYNRYNIELIGKWDAGNKKWIFKN